MGVLDPAAGTVQGKIVYFGAEGAGATANASFLEQKLKRAHRGELRVLEVRHPPHSNYEFLPVHLGRVAGLDTTLHIHTVPTGQGCAEERGKLLDDVDGVVFVADLRPWRREATLRAFAELRDHLAAAGRALESVPIVTQYNHVDEAGVEGLAGLREALGFEPCDSAKAVACKGIGVLESLTSLSKHVLSELRAEATPPTDPSPADPPASETRASEAEAVETEPAAVERHVASLGDDVDADLAEEFPVVEDELPTLSPADGTSHEDLRVEGDGPAVLCEGGLAVPLRLIDLETGRKVPFRIQVRLEVS